MGSCNKNGRYYSLAASPLGSRPLWARRIGAPVHSEDSCLASSVWDSRKGTLYIGGDVTTIGGTSYGGSVRRVSPASGAFGWQTGLPCAVMGTPTLDSAGVLAVGTYTCTGGNIPSAYLIDTATGVILKTLPVGSSRVFSQPVFAQTPCSSPPRQTASITSRRDSSPFPARWDGATSEAVG